MKVNLVLCYSSLARLTRVRISLPTGFARHNHGPFATSVVASQ